MPESPSQPVRSLGAKVGAFVRLRRQKLGLTQKELGQRVGLTAQQVQKYEQGTNLMNLQRLVDFGQALDCPLDLFVALIASSKNSQPRASHLQPIATTHPQGGEKASVFQEDVAPFRYGQEGTEEDGSESAGLSRTELEEFLTCFLTLDCESQRALVTLARNLASAGHPDS